MKRVVLVLLLQIGGSGLLAATDNWKYVAHYGPKGSDYEAEFFISQDRITILPNGNPQVRVLDNGYKSNELPDMDTEKVSNYKFKYLSSIDVYEFDCLGEKYLVHGQTVLFSDGMGRGVPHIPSGYPQQKAFKPVPRGSIYEDLMDAVCK